MAKQNTAKKQIVTSFHNLSAELQDAVKEKYPLGFTDAMMRVDKPNGDFFYAVPFETDEVSYLVKIDDHSQDDDDIKGADDLQGEDDGAESADRSDDDVDI